MSKYNGKRLSSKIRLNKKNHKPEVIILDAPLKNKARVKTSNDYRKLNQHQSDTTSLSDNNLILKKNYQRSALKQANSSLNHGHDRHEEASVSSVNTLIDETTKSSRNGSESLSLKMDRVDMEAKNRMSILRNNWAKHTDVPYVIGANITESKNDTCGQILLTLSWFFIILFFPVSLFLIIKVVQEYE